MAANTAPRRTLTKDGKLRNDPVKAGAKIWQGALVALDANGFLVPGSTSPTLTSRGLASKSVDNSAGANGALSADSERGVHRFDNLPADLITRADLLKPCYIVDDATVARTSAGATRSIAGTIEDLDAQGVWVRIS